MIVHVRPDRAQRSQHRRADAHRLASPASPDRQRMISKRHPFESGDPIVSLNPESVKMLHGFIGFPREGMTMVWTEKTNGSQGRILANRRGNDD